MPTLSTAVTASLISCAVATSAASAQTVLHYWDFSSTADLVGGVNTTMVGAPDLSLSPLYGEAYAGSGATLNTLINGVNGGSGYLLAEVFSGPTLEMDFGMNSFSFSYWLWDDFATDGDARGGRVFDNLAGTSTGIQIATTLANEWNFRVDDDNGAVNIFNNVMPFVTPVDQWYHVVGVVDRGASEVRAYVNGTLTATVPLDNNGTTTPMTGSVFPTQDMQIGVINDGLNAGGAQTQGLDDLAFYDGILSASDAAALASGAVNPLSFGAGITRYCSPGVPNSTGTPGSIDAIGSVLAADNNMTLTAASLPTSAFGFFIVSQTQGMVNQPGGSLGVLCVAGGVGRYVGAGQIQNSGATGTFSLPIDLTMTPTPTGLVPVMSGETWNFQAWHRDSVGGSAVSNFTDAVSVSFQ
ncbi:hypothetical protein Poly30_31000 [Planctomycetes bacterium Poly30]|uniref:LamG-like jellyroll fold domain-containing protein n=1 Tax=Saltatorellus ferox TaxID=2528018 RepID=A0A518EU03_9BACT|nr:hypothetical protein Poly30_31000 [Planctomycetes bacterium Poly30]